MLQNSLKAWMSGENVLWSSNLERLLWNQCFPTWGYLVYFRKVENWFLVIYKFLETVLRIRIQDPVLFWPLDPGSGSEMGKIQSRDPGLKSQIFFSRTLHQFFGLQILKFFDADPDPWSFQPWIRDPGWKKTGSGIRDKPPGSATLVRNESHFWCSEQAKSG